MIEIAAVAVDVVAVEVAIIVESCAITANIIAVVADVHLIVVNIATIVKTALGLGACGEEEACGKEYCQFRFHFCRFFL